MALMLRSRSTLLIAILALLAVPAVAAATLIDVPKDTVPAAKPSCPDAPCLAVSRTTGFQSRTGTNRGLMRVPQDGRLVSWTISLGKPGKKQIAFFDDKLGGDAQAQIAVLRAGTKLRFRTVALGEPQKLEPYFGQTVEFALDKSIPVKKGYIIGLAIPTWAPALAVNLGTDTSWRASRQKGNCEDTQTQTAQQVNGLAQFYCLYKGARLTYSARVIADPVPNPTPKKKSATTRR
jgi:hypothetical protein